MDIILSNNTDVPIYQQIYEQIASQIVNGELVADFCLPSIRSLASELNISVITIKKAWEMLDKNNLIYTIAGKGCFVSAHNTIHLSDKKTKLASDRLQKDLLYYKDLGIEKDEFIRLIEKYYDNKF